jgi:hypothetical protein
MTCHIILSFQLAQHSENCNFNKKNIRMAPNYRFILAGTIITASAFVTETGLFIPSEFKLLGGGILILFGLARMLMGENKNESNDK